MGISTVIAYVISIQIYEVPEYHSGSIKYDDFICMVYYSLGYGLPTILWSSTNDTSPSIKVFYYTR